MMNAKMATPIPSRQVSRAGVGVGLGLALVVGVGVPYAYTNFMPEPAKKPIVAPAPAASIAPPKIDLLASSTTEDATLAKGDAKASTKLAVDDAMILWIKMDVPAAQGGGQGRPPAGAAGTAGGAGGGGGRTGGRRRGPQAPLMLTDDEKRTYAYSLERKDGGIYAIHVKKGYDKKPKTLTLSEFGGGKVIASWPVTDLPEPKVVIPDSSLKGPAAGEIQLRQARRGVDSSVHLTMNLPSSEGVILRPVAASYTPIDMTNPQTLVSKPGETPFDAPISVPNAQMAKLVAFDMERYGNTESSETVTFHTGRIVEHFGQPSLMVMKPETVTTASGLTLTLIKQDNGPLRQPRKTYSEIEIQVWCDTANLKNELPEVAPGVRAEVTSPQAAPLGLSQIRLTFLLVPPPDGKKVYEEPVKLGNPGPAGATKAGPVDITLKLTIIHPKLLGKERIYLPVNSKVLPGNPAAGPMGLSAAR